MRVKSINRRLANRLLYLFSNAYLKKGHHINVRLGVLFYNFRTNLQEEIAEIFLSMLLRVSVKVPFEVGKQFDVKQPSNGLT